MYRPDDHPTHTTRLRRGTGKRYTPVQATTAAVPLRYPVVPMLTILGTLTAIMAANSIVAGL